MENIKQKTVFIASSGFIAVFLPLAVIAAKKGSTLRIFIFITTAWLGYMVAHKSATGRFVDGKNPKNNTGKDGKMAPKDMAEDTGFLGGALMITLGIMIGGMGVKTVKLPLAFGGGILFTGGYVIAHWSTTGELL